MTEFGSLALIDDGGEEEVALSLPGVKEGDYSSRQWKPEIRVSSVRFSPTGRLHTTNLICLVELKKYSADFSKSSGSWFSFYLSNFNKFGKLITDCSQNEVFGNVGYQGIRS